MKAFLSDLHLGDGKERDDFQFHQLFYEKGEGKVGPRLIQQKQESE
jgi:UDP-2,3-diacylglucosamine pyrophosphatase LpxH